MSKLRKAKGWSGAPNAFVRCGALSSDARMLGLWLNSHADNFVIRKSLVARELGLGETRMDNAMRALREAGVLTLVQPKDERGAVVPGPYDWHLDLDAVADVCPAERSAPRKSTPPDNGGGFKKTNFKENQEKENQARAREESSSFRQAADSDPDAKTVWSGLAPRLLKVLGKTKVELCGDGARFAKAVLGAQGWSARDVGEAVLAQCRDEASAQPEERFRKPLHKILMVGTWQCHLGAADEAPPPYEDQVARMERLEREALAAFEAEREAAA